jgi:hypothetical protein
MRRNYLYCQKMAEDFIFSKETRRKTLIKVAGFLTKIRAEYLPKTIL